MRAGPLDALLALALTLGSLAVFRAAPVRQHFDSTYTLLLSAHLLRARELDLARYHLPAEDYRLVRVGARRYHFFPVGAALLSAPYVALARGPGADPLTADGRYDPAGERALEVRLATHLSALYVAVSFATARLLLRRSTSFALSLALAFGTPVFSTTSRALWSDTWGLLLCALALFALLRGEVLRRSPRPLPLALLCVLAYLVRPTCALLFPVAAACLARRRPREGALFALASGLGLALFALWSRRAWGAWLPPYYVAGRLDFSLLSRSLPGLLWSPARGLFVYLPAALWLLLAGWSARGRAPHRSLGRLAALAALLYTLALGGFWHWWGGHSYGPRLFAGLLPWLWLLAVLVLAGLPPGRRPALALSGALCVAWGLFVHPVGALSFEAQRWNVEPTNIDDDTQRLWSWRRPPFLAFALEPEGAAREVPPQGVALGEATAEPWLGLGWSTGEGAFRWTSGSSASLWLRASARERVLELEASPYLPRGMTRQRVRVEVDGRPLGGWELREGGALCLAVPLGAGEGSRRVRLRLLDADSPQRREGAPDTRSLGLAGRWMRTAAAPGERCALPSP